MKNGTSTSAAFPAAFGASRLHAAFGNCAYPWQLGTTNSTNAMHVETVITDSKHRHRWPEEPSP